MSRYAVPTVSPHIAGQMDNSRKPWKVLLEYRGRNKRTGGWSEKWWSMEGDGSGSVKVNHGKIGSNGRTNPFVFACTKGFDTMYKKLSDGYVEAAGSMATMPTLDDKSNHTDLPGVYRDVRYISSSQPGVFMACADDGTVVCHLTPTGAKTLVALSNLVAARTDITVIQQLESLA